MKTRTLYILAEGPFQEVCEQYFATPVADNPRYFYVPMHEHSSKQCLAAFWYHLHLVWGVHDNTEYTSSSSPITSLYYSTRFVNRTLQT